MINNNKHRCHQEKHSKYTKETDKLEEAFKALFPQEDAALFRAWPVSSGQSAQLSKSSKFKRIPVCDNSVTKSEIFLENP
jgi:hypothetical protein